MRLDRANPENDKVYYKFRAGTSDSIYDTGTADEGDYYYNDIYGDVLNFSNLDYDSVSGVWRVGALPAGKRIGMGIQPEYEASGSNVPDDTTDPTFPDRVVAPLAAEISNPHIRDPQPQNNRDSSWLVIRTTTNQSNFRALSEFNTLLEAKADNLRPDNNDGQAVNFTLRMDNFGVKATAPTYSLLSDVKLDITLTGLEVKTAPTTTELNGTTIKCKDSGTANDTLDACAAGDDYAEWDIGILYGKAPLFDGGTGEAVLKDCFGASTTHDEYICRELTLKLALDGNMPLAQRCLEARIRSLPAPNPEDWQGGPLKVCLGADDPPRLLLEDGQVDLFTVYPCVGTGRDAYPCNSDDTDSLEVVAGAYLPLDFTRRSDILGDPAASVHVRNVNSGKAVLQASDNDLFIQVKDPGGRYFDGQTVAFSAPRDIGSSINSGSVVSWHTARNPFYAWQGTNNDYVYNKNANVPGVHLTFTSVPFESERSDWGKVAILTGVGGLKDDGARPPAYTPTTCPDPVSSALPTGLPTLPLAPGDARKRSTWSGRADAEHKTNYANYPWFKLPNYTYLENSRTRPRDTFLEFEKLGTYVLYYHVSGNRSSTATYKPSQTFCDTARYVFHVGPVADLEVTAEKAGSSYTVTAQNHGPDPAENAQVKLNVTGVSATVSRGCFDSSTGVWGLSQQWNATDSKCEDQPYTRLPDDEDHRFHPGDEATLTFTGSYSSLTADIYNQEQCVNAAGVAQSATTELACIYSDTTTTPPTRSGHHWGSYQVCVDYDSGNQSRTADAIYVVNNVRQPIEDENDCTAAASDATYDVGTVYDYNELNSSVTLGVNPDRVTGLSASRQDDDENKIDVTWTAPTRLPLATGYDVEYQSRTGNSGPWSNVWTRAATEIAGTSYTFENAGGGTGYRFRVRAVTASNPNNLTGSWRTSPTVNPVSNPDQVGNLNAVRDGTTETTIDISWTAPTGGTAPTGYDLQYRSRTGNSGSWGTWTDLATNQAETSYQWMSAVAGSSYQFQVRTVTVSGGDTIYGDWRIISSPVVALDAPQRVGNLRAERDTTDATTVTTIEVSWNAASSGIVPTGYEVQYQSRTGNSGDWGDWQTEMAKVAYDADKTTPYTADLTGTTGDNSYRFQVRAYKTLTSSPPPLNGPWQTTGAVPGLVAGDIKADANGKQVRAVRQGPQDDETLIDVSWGAADRATKGYDVEFRKNSGSWQSGATEQSALTYQQDGADGLESYTFRVRAVSNAGPGQWAVSDSVGPAPARYTGVEVGVDWITLKVVSGPWWYKYLAHDGWTGCAKVAAGGNHTITGLIAERAYRVDLFTSSECNWTNGEPSLRKVEVTTQSDLSNPDRCWPKKTDGSYSDCRAGDNPDDFNNHRHQHRRLAQLGVTISGCDWSTRTQHSHGWPDGGSGPHWHCATVAGAGGAGTAGGSSGGGGAESEPQPTPTPEPTKEPTPEPTEEPGGATTAGATSGGGSGTTTVAGAASGGASVTTLESGAAADSGDGGVSAVTAADSVSSSSSGSVVVPVATPVAVLAPVAGNVAVPVSESEPVPGSAADVAAAVDVVEVAAPAAVLEVGPAAMLATPVPAPAVSVSVGVSSRAGITPAVPAPQLVPAAMSRPASEVRVMVGRHGEVAAAAVPTAVSVDALSPAVVATAPAVAVNSSSLAAPVLPSDPPAPPVVAPQVGDGGGNQAWLLMAGYALAVVAAGVVVYLLLRRRMRWR